MSKSRLELLKKELLEGDKGNYSTFSVRFSGYSARQLLNEIEFLQKRGESGKVAKKARRRAHKAEALARELAEVLLLYEKWEADLLMDNSLWQSASGLPFITQEVWDELVAVQTERNKVLHKAKEVLDNEQA